MKKILITKIGALGDTVDSSCWPELLNNNGFQIDIITNKGTEIIWEDNKFINELFILKIPSVKSLGSIKLFIKFIFNFKYKTFNKKYDYVFVFNANLNLARIISLLTSKKVYHFSHTYRRSRWIQKTRLDILRTRQEEQLLKRSGLKIETPKSLKLYFKPKRINKKIKSNQRVIAIAIGGGNPISNANSRSLTKEFLINLIKSQNKKTTIIFLGKGASDQYRINSLKDFFKSYKGRFLIELMDLTNKLSLKQVFYILKKSNIFIGGDTGLSKIAAASGIKSLILFGPTSSKLASPIGDNVIALDSNYSCVTCYAPQEGTFSTMYSCQDYGCMKWHNDKIDLVNNLINEN